MGNLEETARDASRTLRQGEYTLYVFNREGFERVVNDLSGDDWFYHNPEMHPNIGLMPSGDNIAQVWLHSSPFESGAARLSNQILLDYSGAMGFLKTWRTGTRLRIGNQGNVRSLY